MAFVAAIAVCGALMELARIRGTAVATRKAPGLEGMRLLVAVPEDEQGRPTGDAIVPVDHAVVGLVDGAARR